jgi:DNA (cytosine-5)-methyltransferase 1
MYEHTPPGKAFMYASEHYLNQPGKWHSHVRLSWDKPSYTVLQSKAQTYHPDECRPLTIPEVKRVCSFPDDYVLTGNYGQQWERCGRSVPPVMMYHIATAVAQTLRAV